MTRIRVAKRAAVKALVAGALTAAAVLGASGVANAAGTVPTGGTVIGEGSSVAAAAAAAARQCKSGAIETDGPNYHVFSDVPHGVWTFTVSSVCK